MTQPTPLGLSLRTGLVLFAFTLAFTALMAGTYRATKDVIAASTAEEKLRLIGEVLPPGEYDNALLEDYVVVPPTAALGLDESTRVFRARKAGRPVALVLEASAPDGYAGAIRLIVAVRPAGELVAVRVTQHRETPGLGDYIDIRKDRNRHRPWITQFNDASFERVARAQWKVRKDGGRFDQVAGATITARAVTGAVARALDYAVAERDRLLAAPSGAAP